QFQNPGIEERLRGGNPLRLALMPDDLAGAYVFLASRNNARGITGSIVTVDAGAMLRMPRPRCLLAGSRWISPLSTSSFRGAAQRRARKDYGVNDDRHRTGGRFRQRARQPAHLYRAGDLSGGAGAHLRALLALSVP